MGKRSSHKHGTFSWVDNATTDQEGAKAFYAAVLGWEYRDSPIGDGVYYSMALTDGEDAAAIAPQQQDEIDQGIPAHWNSYVTVDDVDAVSARVNDLGGNLVVQPFDVMDVGRMSVLLDPTGAPLCLWEARANIGAKVVNQHGALCWNELNTRDAEAARTFFGELLGWTYEPLPPEAGMEYWTIKNGDRSNGGIRPMGPEMPAEVPAHWLTYFGVDSIDAALEAASANGGEVIMGRTELAPGNALAVLRDPVGAVFAIFEGTFDD